MLMAPSAEITARSTSGCMPDCKHQPAFAVRRQFPIFVFSAKTWLTLYGSLDIAKIAHRPWSKQMSLQFTVENMLNDRIQVRDRTGATPNRFQAAYLDPLGRSVRLGLRKLF